MTRISGVSLVALLTLLFAACNVLPESESVRRFLLPQEGTDEERAFRSSAEATLPLVLRVHSPQASQILASTRIAVVPDESEISSYRGARWAQPVPNLLRDRVVEAFLQNGRLAGVVDEQNRLDADLVLTSKLRAFQSEYVDGKPQVRILLDAQLSDSGTRELIASRRFEVLQESPGESIESVVASFGRASDQLSGQLVDWTLEQVTERNK